MSLKGFNDIIGLWKDRINLPDAAIELTIEQAEELEKIVNDDNEWKKLLEIFKRGRVQDAWLASEWPAGFDELVICAPLCKLVDWECSKCHVGIRQGNFSCANDDSLFGYIAILISMENRDLLTVHLQKIKLLLQNRNLFWDMKTHEIFLNSGYTAGFPDEARIS